MDRQDDRNDELDGHEPGGSHGRTGGPAPRGRAVGQEPDAGRGDDHAGAGAREPEDEGSYPPRTEEDHVAGASEPSVRSSVEPESSRLDDRTRMRDIMKRVNDALHRVRPKN